MDGMGEALDDDSLLEAAVKVATAFWWSHCAVQRQRRPMRGIALGLICRAIGDMTSGETAILSGKPGGSAKQHIRVHGAALGDSLQWNGLRPHAARLRKTLKALAVQMSAGGGNSLLSTAESADRNRADIDARDAREQHQREHHHQLQQMERVEPRMEPEPSQAPGGGISSTAAAIVGNDAVGNEANANAHEQQEQQEQHVQQLNEQPQMEQQREVDLAMVLVSMGRMPCEVEQVSGVEHQPDRQEHQDTNVLAPLCASSLTPPPCIRHTLAQCSRHLVNTSQAPPTINKPHRP